MAGVQDQTPVQETLGSKLSETVALLAENGHAHSGKAGPEENMHGRNGKRDRSMTSDDVEGVPPSSNEHANGKDAPPTSEADSGAPETAQLLAERLAVEVTGAQQALQQAISVVVEKQTEASALAKEAANEFSVGKEDTKTSAVQDSEEVMERAPKQQKLDLSSTDASQQAVQQNVASITENVVAVAHEEPTSQSVAQPVSLQGSTEECVTAVQDGTQPTEAEDKPFTLKVATQTPPQGPSPMQVG